MLYNKSHLYSSLVKKVLISFFALITFCCAAHPSTPKAYSLAPESDVNQSTPVAEVPERVMLEVSTFDDETITALITALQEQDAAGKEIWLRINTNGGSVSGMFMLTQALEQLKQPITCVADWHAFSAGAFLLEQPGCAKRLATRRAMILFHEASSQAEGNEHQINETMKRLHVISQVLVNQVASRIGMPEKELWNRIYNQAWTVGYEEALKYHVIDSVVEIKDLPPLIPVVVEHNLLRQLLGG